QSPCERLIESNDAHTLRPAQEHVVFRQESFELVDLSRKPIEKRIDRLVEAACEVFPQAADTEVARKKPEAGHQLVDIHQQLALAYGIEQHRRCADLERVRTDPDEMARDPLQFSDE